MRAVYYILYSYVYDKSDGRAHCNEYNIPNVIIYQMTF